MNIVASSLLPKRLPDLLPQVQPNVSLAGEGFRRYVWRSAFSEMVIEPRGEAIFVNGKLVIPAPELGVGDE